MKNILLPLAQDVRMAALGKFKNQVVNADEETWGTFVFESIGIEGEEDFLKSKKRVLNRIFNQKCSPYYTAWPN